ncbi:hypothetical protein FGG08_003545 [Glutinoglossum americanum]|uniref:Vegetative cell wall protein gp1 n=1 Tax=Glutinoglossum americanum TaxID=1670608 RepID=A0A9P8I6V9_9PEZI|nr:hypothetical protein FGG08_003545 [Glutinoglossum americanum]
MFSPPPNFPPPPGFVPYGPYSTATPLSSPSPAGPHAYYPSPRYSMPAASPSSPRGSPKRHSRRASGSQNPAEYAYASPRGTSSSYQSSPGYATPGPGYYPGYASPNANAEFVSSSDREARHVYVKSGKRRASQYRDPSFDDDFAHARRKPPRYQSYRYADDYHYYDQTPVYEPSTPRERSRRSSHSTRPGSAVPPRSQTAAPQQTQKPKVTQVKPSPKATDEDARRANIPAGYSIKNWDPTEVPILLLGSVFDANSLGKWIYDWTVFHHGPATPMSDLAGELWLLLIQLAGKVKRAQECMPRIRKQENQEMVEDFLDSGDRLWARFKRLLKACEEYMWRAAERKGGSTSNGKEKVQVQMGKNSGCEFVDSIFGRERELEKTEKLMTGMRLWSMRFDANCEEILRRPTV